MIEENKLIEVRGNKPLYIDKPDFVYKVITGKVDIFAAIIEDGKITGNKYNIARIEKNELFFGVESENTVFIASGTPETTCKQITFKDFLNDFSVDDRIKYINLWINKVIKSVTISLSPRGMDKISKVSDFEIGEEKSVTTKEEIIWIESVDGKIKFNNNFEINFLFPITKDSWITAGKNSVINSYLTSDIIDSKDFLNIFKKFNNVILSLIHDYLKQAKESEKKRLKIKIANQLKTFETGLIFIRNVLLPDKKKDLTEIDKDKPLLSVCKIIGKYQKFKIVPHPEDNSNLQNILRTSGIKERKVALKEEWWKNDSGPLLGFYTENKLPVALIPDSPTSYNLIDVVNDKEIKVNNEISEQIEPFGYTFYRPFPKKALTGWELFKFGITNCGYDIFMVFLIGVCGALLGLLTPIFTGLIFDTLIPEAAVNQLFQIAFILISCAIATLLFEITKATALLRLEGKADYSLQAAIWDRLMSLPVPFFKNYSSGELAMRSMGIDSIRQILSGVTVQSILSFIFALFYWGLLFYYNVGLAVIASIIGIVLIAFTFTIGYISVKNQEKINELKNKISGVIFQLLSGIAKLRITGTEVNAFYLWSKMFSEQKKINKRLGTTQNIMKTFSAIFPLLSMMCIFSWVTFKVGNGLTTGDFLAFNSAYSSFQNGLLQMSMALVMSLNIIPIYKNLKPIIETLPEVTEAKKHPGELTGDIEVNHLYFKYTPDGNYVLKDVSLKINPGEFVAIVGGSGSGKSTLFRLLLGFEIPEKGKIFYNGNDLELLDILEVRKQLGVVLQNAKLLQGSIFDNITGSANLTVDDAWEAAKAAGCYDDIKSMPMKMHTMVPPGGGNLSGGQRQRIIIARALIKKPRIIFFDEATSALDNKTQATVSESLENMKVARVVIAHRLSTVKNADKIYCLDKGVIVEEGTYETLMAKQGFFYELAKRQIA